MLIVYLLNLQKQKEFITIMSLEIENITQIHKKEKKQHFM